MERPGLAALLADVKAGQIDAIVIYKIDRLTRSLADFARIAQQLEQAGASFVSVTQSFNTKTSMGRLMLHVLLSFAQFEREVGAERVRDKIAASKAKGMWMGGTVPLGYDAIDRKLVINPAEANTVRALFERFVELGSLQATLRWSRREGLKTKPRVRSGRQVGGNEFTYGSLRCLLANHLYAGDVSHKGKVYVGQHEGIVERELFDRAQAILATRKTAAISRPRLVSAIGSLLSDGTNQERRVLIVDHISKVTIGDAHLTMQLTDGTLLERSLERVRHGNDARLVIGNVQERAEERADQQLVLLLREAQRLRVLAMSKPGLDLIQLAEAAGRSSERTKRLLRLSYLSPKIVEAILAGKQPANVPNRFLQNLDRLPLAWSEQEQLLLN